MDLQQIQIPKQAICKLSQHQADAIFKFCYFPQKIMWSRVEKAIN